MSNASKSEGGSTVAGGVANLPGGLDTAVSTNTLNQEALRAAQAAYSANFDHEGIKHAVMAYLAALSSEISVVSPLRIEKTIASHYCACYMTDGFCNSDNREDCKCRKIARDCVKSLERLKANKREIIDRTKDLENVLQSILLVYKHNDVAGIDVMAQMAVDALTGIERFREFLNNFGKRNSIEGKKQSDDMPNRFK